MAPESEELVRKVEAVLFAAGKPLSAREIAEALGDADAKPVGAAVKALESAYGRRPSALEVRRVGDRYALQLKEPYVPAVHSVTPVEMAPRTVKALTLIAYHQPLLQSVLVRMIGDVAYEEVQHLRSLGLVRTDAKGSTLELTTTRRFAEYFGIASTRPEEIRRFLEQKLGVPPAPEITIPAAAVEPPPAPLSDDGGPEPPSPDPTAPAAPSDAPADPSSG